MAPTPVQAEAEANLAGEENSEDEQVKQAILDQLKETAAEQGISPEQLYAAVQDRLQGDMEVVGTKMDYLETLPPKVRGRLNALKHLQVEYAHIEGQFYEEAHDLEMKYAELFKPLYEKRRKVVSGEHTPTEEESKWVDPAAGSDDEDDEDDEGKELTDKPEDVITNGDIQASTEEEKIAEDVMLKLNINDDVEGIPEFWLNAMKNEETIAEMIQECDEPILKHLTDIQLNFTSKLAGNADMGFVLEFMFGSNEFFTNTSLTKTYTMKCEPEADDPFSFDGPDIVACTGCTIDWSKGKNVTVKTVKKKQTHKGKGQTRVVQKTIKNDSFFNFFNPPEAPSPDADEEYDEDLQALLEADFEIGHFFREQLIPKAVLYFTGEAIEEDSDDEEDDEYDDEDGSDDDDDDGDDDAKPPAIGAPNGEQPAECKQQ